MKRSKQLLYTPYKFIVVSLYVTNTCSNVNCVVWHDRIWLRQAGYNQKFYWSLQNLCNTPVKAWSVTRSLYGFCVHTGLFYYWFAIIIRNHIAQHFYSQRFCKLQYRMCLCNTWVCGNFTYMYDRVRQQHVCIGCSSCLLPFMYRISFASIKMRTLRGLINSLQ